MSRNPVSLKQRLAALAAGPAAPAEPGQPPQGRPTHTKRRSLFAAPWAKRHGRADSLGGAERERDLLQEVMGRMIYQAGVDYETRPMVVINASALPDPKEVSYDLLLLRILSYLDLYVESDYTVVFFAAGGRHTPGWNWIWKAYRSLGRSYRKHLKALYIVHSNFFSKMLFSLAGAMISPKFFRKLQYLDTLTALAYHVPITQIDIPPAVYQENMKYEREIKLPMPIKQDIFGVPLEELMGWDAEKGGVPRVVKDAVQYLRETGLEEEGLFRRSPNSALLRHVQQAYDRGHVVNLETFGDSHLAAVLIKKYLRDLPEPIFPESLYPVIRHCPRPTNDPGDVAAVIYIRETLLPQLPTCAYVLLSYVLHLMHEVSLRASFNRMDAYNLTLVLCPNLLKSANPVRDVQMSTVQNDPPAGAAPADTTLGTVLKVCIARYYECFEDLPDRTEAVAPAPDESPSVSSLASSLVAVGDEGNFTIGDDEHDLEDDEDGVLVMPVGGAPPSAFKPHHRTTRSRASKVSSNGSVSTAAAARSLNAGAGGSAFVNGAVAMGGKGRARSIVSVDKGSTGGGSVSRTGSISIGRGKGTFRTGKSAGAGVEALGVTASGFFTAPGAAPPVPPAPDAEAAGAAPHGGSDPHVDGA